MLTGDLIDTVLNVMTFAFVGAMVWLFLRKPGQDAGDEEENETN